ncbi:hypothetical protein PR202_ga29492 [Eleusine coracana subsp. coracana]|uniref:Peptidase S8/S53 domain-containing protein n=1 Tax=Eleusine coracana subsp. coracana TaxID=191504 RepID=A0AAV5DLJ3_ELECO|nr:hypothetical protein PR202_ga29492 [Eleusine coracana subsp. coracana]
MAPKARIAMYSVCDSGVCPEADIIAAVDAAVKDGVDILSMSLGPKVQPPLPFHSDSIAIATFGAVRAGVFVALAGGNDGPKESTVENVAPWMTTVGAASVDRLFPGNLHLGDGTVLQGQSLYAMKATRMSPLVYSPCDDDNKKYLLRHKMNGKIAVCDNGTASDSGVNEIKQAGAYGVIYLDRRSKSSDGSKSSTRPFRLSLSASPGPRSSGHTWPHRLIR